MLHNDEYIDYVGIIRNVFIYSRVISLSLKDIKSPLFIVLILFSQYTQVSVLYQKHLVLAQRFSLSKSLTKYRRK